LKLDVKRKVLLLVLSGSLLTFLLLAVCMGYGWFHARDLLNQQSEKLGEDTAAYAEDLIETQIEKRMESVTRLRAQNLNRELENVAMDADYLAEEISTLLKRPRKPSQQLLPNTLYNEVPIGHALIHYNPSLAKQGYGPSQQRQVSVPLGMVNSLERMSKYYPNVFAGSKEGWVAMIETDEDRKGQLSFLCREPFRHSYNPLERDWYKIGIDAAKPTFTDAYLDAGTGEPCVSCVMQYVDAGGFAGVTGVDCNVLEIYEQIMKTSVSSSEHSFVMGRKGEIIVSSKKEGLLSVSKDRSDLRQSAEPDLARAAANMVAGRIGMKPVTLEGKSYYLAYAPIELMGWSFGTLVDRDETLLPAMEAKEDLRDWLKSFGKTLGKLFAGFAMKMALAMGLLLLGFIYFSTWSAKRFVKPILELEDGVRQIARGNLDKTLSVRTGDEIEDLANSVNNMTADLKSYIADLSKITAEKERIATELSVAKNIQEGMLPKTFPAFPDKKEIDIYASMQAAKSVGGDFYDFYFVDEDHLAITIGDVSGKGIPAALFMVVAKTVLQNYTKLLKTPEALSEIVTRANSQLCENNEEDMFVTVFTGLLDIRTGEFRYVNAGHNAPLLRHGADGRFAYLPKADNCFMGIMEGMEYQANTLKLAPGDCLYLYTDGVTEAMNEKEELFTNEKLRSVLGTVSREAAVKDILTLVSAEVKAHAGSAEQSDDVTMLGLVYHGAN